MSDELRRLSKLVEIDHDEQEQRHYKTLRATGFWGQQGAGCVFQAVDTGRLLLAHRSWKVEQPGTWGTWGGALDEDEHTPEEAMHREVREEAGYHGEYNLIPLFVFSKPTPGGGVFRYSNFLALTESEFRPHLNWETQGAEWFLLNDLPSPLHFGLEALLADAASLKVIKHYAEAGGGVPRRPRP